MTAIQNIAVIGAGAWGTALAATARRAGRSVRLWVREPDLAETIREQGENPSYLPGVPLPPGVEPTTDLGTAVDGADAVLLVTPAQVVREISGRLKPLWPGRAPAVIAAKGLEIGTGALLSDAVAETLPGVPVAILSGPTFAKEVAEGRPSAITLACAEEEPGAALVQGLGTHTFRPYWSADVIGAQIGGGVKNVMAIAAGIVAGRELGDNARAALITRGLAELVRLSTALGGRPETLMGLSGLGDLTLTCTGELSRNMTLGRELGRGRSLDEVLGERHTVAEGVHTARAVAALGREKGVDMPICQAVNAVLTEGLDIESVIERLLSRPFRPETA